MREAEDGNVNLYEESSSPLECVGASAIKNISNLPDELKNMTVMDLQHVFVGNVMDPQEPNKIVAEDVALSLHGFELSKLKVVQIRKLCSLMGIPKYNGMGKIVCQALILYAKKIRALPMLMARTQDIKLNTKFRIVNAYFHDDNFNHTCRMNDLKT